MFCDASRSTHAFDFITGLYLREALNEAAPACRQIKPRASTTPEAKRAAPLRRRKSTGEDGQMPESTIIPVVFVRCANNNSENGAPDYIGVTRQKLTPRRQPSARLSSGGI
jgi:hypothetical protein